MASRHAFVNSEICITNVKFSCICQTEVTLLQRPLGMRCKFFVTVYGSIFVTLGSVNPTSAIQALALFIGDQIKANIGNFFD